MTALPINTRPKIRLARFARPKILMSVLTGTAAADRSAEKAAASAAAAQDLLQQMQDIVASLGLMEPLEAGLAGDGTPGPFPLPITVTSEKRIVLFVGGAIQTPTVDYTATGNQLTFTENTPDGVPITGFAFSG